MSAARRLTEPGVLIPFIIVTLIWGSTWIVIRDQLNGVPPSWSVAYRFILASAVMLIIALVRRERLEGGRSLALAALIGVSLFCLNFNLVYRSEHYITSGLVAVIFGLLFVPNAVLARLWLGVPIERRFLAGGALAVAGAALLLAHEARGVTGSAWEVALGSALVIGGVLAASVANVAQATELARRQGPFALLGIAMALGALADVIVAWATAGPPVFDPRAGYGAGLVYLALGGSVAAFPLYLGVIRAVGPGPAAWSSALVPVVAMALSTLFEGYQWSALSVAGSLLVAAGLTVALKR